MSSMMNSLESEMEAPSQSSSLPSCNIAPSSNSNVQGDCVNNINSSESDNKSPSSSSSSSSHDSITSSSKTHHEESMNNINITSDCRGSSSAEIPSPSLPSQITPSSKVTSQDTTAQLESPSKKIHISPLSFDTDAASDVEDVHNDIKIEIDLPSEFEVLPRTYRMSMDDDYSRMLSRDNIPYTKENTENLDLKPSLPSCESQFSSCTLPDDDIIIGEVIKHECPPLQNFSPISTANTNPGITSEDHSSSSAATTTLGDVIIGDVVKSECPPLQDFSAIPTVVINHETPSSASTSTSTVSIGDLVVGNLLDTECPPVPKQAVSGPSTEAEAVLKEGAGNPPLPSSSGTKRASKKLGGPGKKRQKKSPVPNGQGLTCTSTQSDQCDSIVNEPDLVLGLQKRPFLQRSIQERRDIVTKGRPTPLLLAKQSSGRRTRSFTPTWYTNYEWLCGRIATDAMYCWPCLLFQPNNNVSFVRIGFTDYFHCTRQCHRHARSMYHLKCFKQYAEFKKRADFSRSCGKITTMEKVQHNEKVLENRKYLNHLTYLVLYLCKQELALCGNNQMMDGVDNTYDKYKELLNCLAKVDFAFASWLKIQASDTDSSFSPVSSSTKDDIIASIDNVIKAEICSEVQSTPFYSLQIEGFENDGGSSQVSVIIRYVSGCEIHERFLGLFDIVKDNDGNSLSNTILKVLHIYNAKTKLISQTYVGALNRVEIKLKEEGFKYGNHVHFDDLKLSSIVNQVAEKNSRVKVFFSQLHSCNKFLSPTSKMKRIFCNFGISIPSLDGISQFDRVMTISFIKLNLHRLRDVLQHILDNANSWNEETVGNADNILTKLNDFTFILYINCFYDIFSQTGLDFNFLECKMLNIELLRRNINGCSQILADIHTDEHYENIEKQTQSDFGTMNTKCKVTSKNVNFKESYFEIIDNLLMSIRERFNYMEEYAAEFAFRDLLCPKQFVLYDKMFPQHLVVSLQKKYPDILDFESLSHELKFVYSDTDFIKCSSALSLLEYVHEMDLCSAFPEFVRLINLVLTLPEMSAVVVGGKESKLSTLDKTRAYLSRMKTTGDLSISLSSCAMISLNRIILDDLESKCLLNAKILQEFAIKPGRSAFILM